MKSVLITISLICAGSLAKAQSFPQYDQAISTMKQLQDAWMSEPVAFDIKYFYSNEHTPTAVLDSVQGHIEMSGKNYRCLLDNTETIRNDRFTIILFGEDKIMYLAKSNSAAPEASLANPVLMMQTALERAGVKECMVHVRGQYKVLRFNFAQDAACRQIEVTIDTARQQLTAMQYVVKTALLMEEPGTGEESGYDEYALVRASFSNYGRQPIANNRFDERSFFFSEGEEYKATEKYNDYKIFIASPQL